MPKKITPTIYQLRKQGFKVRVIHSTEEDGQRVTKIEVTSPEGLSGWGTSYCHPKDGYNRKLGNTIALGRALASFDKNTKNDLDVYLKKMQLSFGV